MPLWFRRAQPIQLVVTVITEGKTTKVRIQVGLGNDPGKKQYSDLENQSCKLYALCIKYKGKRAISSQLR